MAGKSFSFSAVLTLIDKATKPLKAVNDGLEHLTDPLRKISNAARVASHEMGRFAELTGIAAVAERARKASESVVELGRHLGELVGPLAVIGGIGSLGGLLELTHGTAEYSKQITLAMQKTGGGAEELQVLQYMAKETGVDFQTLVGALGRTNRLIADIAAGKNQQALIMFDRLGIKIRDTSGHLRTATQIFPELSEAIKRNDNAAVQAFIGNMVFGRSFETLLPMLQNGRDGVEEYRKEAEKLGLVLTDKQIAEGNLNADSWEHIGTAVKGVSLAIGTSLIPALTPLFDKLTDVIAANRQLIGQRVAEMLSGIAQAISTIDWESVGSAAMSVAHVFAFIAEHGWAMKAALVAIGAALAGPLLLALIQVGQAVVALGIAILSTPIGWIMAGIVALVVAGYLIYENWSQITAWLGKKWGEIKALFMGAVGWLTGIGHNLVDGIKAGFAAAWTGLETFITSKIAALASLLPDWMNPLVKTPAGDAGRRRQSFTDAAAPFLGGNTTAPAPVMQIMRPGAAPSTFGQSIYAGSSPAVPAAPQGQVDVTVSFDNAPQGTRVESRQDGRGINHSVDLGHAWAN